MAPFFRRDRKQSHARNWKCRMRLRIVLLALLVIAATIYLFNASWLAPAQDGKPVFLAHRGVHQTFHREGLTADSCTATMIHPPTHNFIENTLPSMRAAFEAGASIVEFDIHPTTDGHFSVFHDWTLDCRTDGRGVTREHSLADLRKLDVGHGYTSDGGKTFPLRGKGVGAIPTLDEVLAAFPGKGFFIHIKGRDRTEGEKLAARLKLLTPEQRAPLVVYGASEPVEEVKRQLPDLRVGSRGALKDCFLRYIASGWFGHVPEACRGRVMMVPVNIAPWLWGWPNRFMARMNAADARVFILGDYDGGNFSTGIDTPADLARLPKNFPGGIWTNRIEAIAPLLMPGAPREP
jgi:glycerophosphoryl diester phosphodiesterase